MPTFESTIFGYGEPITIIVGAFVSFATPGIFLQAMYPLKVSLGSADHDTVPGVSGRMIARMYGISLLPLSLASHLIFAHPAVSPSVPHYAKQMLIACLLAGDLLHIATYEGALGSAKSVQKKAKGESKKSAPTRNWVGYVANVGTSWTLAACRVAWFWGYLP
ncbi:hypothetical protein M427DRAFT_56534 [Gonapodya prolifera JEL478]|uniref:DUF7704 domain-containing protein n=1 Tax=Gonapodya prolifera (strain JEL478) TaxID=1344416 RepID=A0A139AGL0_GONPJ|nr:hypothetical protein M427DRAFT_56534 [Gonapodya prolifera JEL478]|eukprot:KXS15704.1 hypothetical protein M427DRAFT_56534 [Gonapodya prolifera JEL478]